MISRQRRAKTQAKYRTRYKRILNQSSGPHGKLYYLKRTATPCSCAICKRERYDRNRVKREPIEL